MADNRLSDVSICPRCGTSGPPIMNFEGTLPMLENGWLIRNLDDRKLKYSNEAG